MNVHSLSNRGSFLEQGRCQACRRFLRVAIEAGGLLRGFEMVEFATSLFSKAARRVGMAASVLFESLIKINRRSDIVTPGRALQDVNPSHLKMCQGGELNSRPRAYESPALPLSYPGV